MGVLMAADMAESAPYRYGDKPSTYIRASFLEYDPDAFETLKRIINACPGGTLARFCIAEGQACLELNYPLGVWDASR